MDEGTAISVTPDCADSNSLCPYFTLNTAAMCCGRTQKVTQPP